MKLIRKNQAMVSTTRKDLTVKLAEFREVAQKIHVPPFTYSADEPNDIISSERALPSGPHRHKVTLSGVAGYHPSSP